ncbi:SCO family protein [Roseomonas chloroacetimidivorans]|uniref:SCO family protein n=1 Tax=Roseomonas chloroacetimidivorans TaxID=1766656 RepID=UPI003C7520CE
MLRWVRRITWCAVAILGFLVLATSGGWLVTDGPLSRRQASSGQTAVAIGGPFSLTDHRGRAVTERDFAGKPSAVFFGFTFCPDVCPTTLANMTAQMDALGPDADRINWLLISVDHERDTPQVLAQYLEPFDSRIVGLTGTEQQVEGAARSFQVQYRRVPLEGGGYTMDHSASVFLLDAAGRFAGTLDYEESQAVATEKLRLLVARAP